MTRLVDYWPSSDNEMSSSETTNIKKTVATRDQNLQPTLTVRTPTRHGLVPRSGIATSSRKIRRLGKPNHGKTNLLFQPWSPQDSDGSQARSQTTMLESPAKIGLITEFEQHSPPNPARASHLKAFQPIRPTQQSDSEEDMYEDSLTQAPKLGALKGYAVDNCISDRPKSSPHSTSNVHGMETSFCLVVNPHGNEAQDEVTAKESRKNADDDADTGSNHKLSSAPLPVLCHHNAKMIRTKSLGRDYTTLSGANIVAGPDLEWLRQSADDNTASQKRSSDAVKDQKTSSLPPIINKDINSGGKGDNISELLAGLQLGSDSETETSGDALSFFTPPAGPQKSLRSPRTHVPIPQTPHKAGTNSFWSQDVVDNWNNEHATYRPVKLSDATNGSQRATNRAKKRDFQAAKQRLADEFWAELDTEITHGQITDLAKTAGGVKLIWTRSLNTTAGRANWRRETVRTKDSDGVILEVKHKHHASVELAEKVIDDENKLLNVLAHEFCHLATFMISGITTNPHGKEFKSWASKCSQAFSDRGIHVTTKHSYNIDFKYIWECVRCGSEYKRHSKSIDIERHRCGGCKGKLQQTRPVPRSNTKNINAAPTPTKYQLFLKEHMKEIKKENPSISQRDVMKVVAEKWAESKNKLTTNDEKTTATVKERPDITTKLMIDLTLDS